VFENGSAGRNQPLVAIGTVFAAALIGAAIPVYVSAMGDGVARMMVLPAGIALLTLLLADRKGLLILILVLRSAGDIFFEATRFSSGGFQSGVGGVINAFVILIVLLLVAEKPDSLPRKVISAWAGFLLISLIGVAISPFKSDAVRIYLTLLSYFAIFAGAFYVVRSPADYRLCIRIVLWSSVIPAIYALVQLATGGGHAFGSGLRLNGTFTHPNIFAFYLVLVISLTLYMLKSSSKALSIEARTGLYLYMILLLSLLLLTQTRSAWIACFMIFAIYGLLFERRYLVYLVVALIVALLIPSVQDRLFDLSTGNVYVQYAKLNSFAWRRLIWETSLQYMQPDHYFLGYGMNSFMYHSLTFFPLADPSGRGAGAHNVYVQLLFETGVAGLLTFVWLFIRLLQFLKPMLSLDRLAAFFSIGSIIAYLIVSFSDNMLGYLAFNWYFWFMVGAACSLVATTSKAKSEVRQSALPGIRPSAGK